MILTSANVIADDGKVAGKTFRLLPLNLGCPFQVVQWSSETNSLILLTREKTTELRAIPKMSESGEIMRNKAGQPLVERRQFEDFMEFSISDTNSIVDFIEAMAINAENKMLYMPFISSIQVNHVEKPSLITSIH